MPVKLKSITFGKRLLCLFVFFLALFFTIEWTARAQNTFVVTKTADTNDGVCDADCSLREAVVAANTNAGADVVTFNIPSSDTGCTPANVCTIRLGSTISISQNLTIDGSQNAADITISGDTNNDN